MTHAEYVKKYLEPAFTQARGSEIASIDYVENPQELCKVQDDGRRHYEQELIVTYRNGYYKVVNVTMDSQLAFIKDMFNQDAVF